VFVEREEHEGIKAPDLGRLLFDNPIVGSSPIAQW